MGAFFSKKTSLPENLNTPSTPLEERSIENSIPTTPRPQNDEIISDPVQVPPIPSTLPFSLDDDLHFLVPPLPFRSQWTLLYDSGQHGWSASRFHELCDGKGATLTVVRLMNQRILGGFTPIPWQHTPGNMLGDFMRDPESQTFLFCAPPESAATSSFFMGPLKPFVFKLHDKSRVAVRHLENCGPSFGDKDLTVQLDQRSFSSSSLGGSFNVDALDDPAHGLTKAQRVNFLAGSHTNWKIASVEVYLVE